MDLRLRWSPQDAQSLNSAELVGALKTLEARLSTQLLVRAFNVLAHRSATCDDIPSCIVSQGLPFLPFKHPTMRTGGLSTKGGAMDMAGE